MPSLTYGVRFGDAEQPLGVGLVLGEQQRGVALAVEVALAQLGMRRRDRRACAVAACRSTGRGASPPHDQVLRNQSVGSTCSVGRLRAAVVDA